MIYSQQSLSNAKEITPHLFSINNFFTNQQLETLVNKLIIETNWVDQEQQVNGFRKRLKWITNGTLDLLWADLNQLDFSKFNLKFKTVMIWKDSPGYSIGPHSDNSSVVAAMQIYLNHGPMNLGTWFNDIEIPYQQNCGYFMINKTYPTHCMRSTVPENFTRYSMYVLFEYV